MAVLHWKEKRIWKVTWAGKHHKPAANKFDVDAMTILPGVHEYDDELWEGAKANNDVKEAVESGKLLEVVTKKTQGKTEQEGQGLPPNLSKFNVVDATDLISGIMDVETLTAWSKAEKRASVKDAIDKQVKMLKKE